VKVAPRERAGGARGGLGARALAPRRAIGPELEKTSQMREKRAEHSTTAATGAPDPRRAAPTTVTRLTSRTRAVAVSPG